MNPRAACTFQSQEAIMDEKEKRSDELPGSDPKTIEKEAEKSRRELDEIPEPGTDPLHEGP